MAELLQMLQIVFDGRQLARAEKRHGLGHSSRDLGYLAHAQLAACFGDLAPRPFCVRQKKAGLEILGYGSADAAALRRQAADFAEPFYAASWSHLDSKVMREDWPEGHHFGFEIRVCPVVRLHAEREIPLIARKEGESTGMHRFRKGAEVDVFQRDLGEEGLDAGLTRRAAYERWLRKSVGEAAELLHLDMMRFQLSTLYRRTQGADREGRRLKRPDATFTGELLVRDGRALVNLLRVGVGRHCAFGFGMLLLRRPD